MAVHLTQVIHDFPFVESGVTISKSVKKNFFSHCKIVMKFEHSKGLTLNLEVPQ